MHRLPEVICDYARLRHVTEEHRDREGDGGGRVGIEKAVEQFLVDSTAR